MQTLTDSCPISRLPDDILCIIFDKGAEDTPDFEVLVSWVCSHWRNVAIRCPSLWTIVEIYYQDKQRVSRFDRSATYLDRYQGCPLRIDVNIYRVNTYGDPSPAFQQIIDHLFLNAYRWHSLRIASSWSCTSFHYAVNRLYDITAPALRNLWLDAGTSSTVSRDGSRFPLLSGDVAPLLSHVEISSLTIASHIPFSVASLTCLSLEATTHYWVIRYNTFHQLLTSSPNLVELRLLGEVVDFSQVSIIPGNTKLPSLQSLVILPRRNERHIDASFFETLLTVISAPELSRFAYTETKNLRPGMTPTTALFEPGTSISKFPNVFSLSIVGLLHETEAHSLVLAFPETVELFIKGPSAESILEELCTQVTVDDVPVLRWPHLNKIVVPVEAVQRRSSSSLSRLLALRERAAFPQLTVQAYSACPDCGGNRSLS